MIDVKMHCEDVTNFEEDVFVRAFSYKDYSIEIHNHEFYEINIVLSGSGTHCIEDGKIEVSAGDVFVIPPMVAHGYTDTKNLEVYHIIIKKDFLTRNSEEARHVKGFLEFIEIEPFLRSNFSNAVFLHLSFTQLAKFCSNIEFIDDKSEFNSAEFLPIKYHTVWKILYWFSSLLTEQIKTMEKSNDKKYEAQIIDVLNYIHNHYAEKISIDVLCKKTYLSRSTFLRAFFDVCGQSPIEYLNKYRSQKAAELLDNTSYSKTQIAHSCGFYDLSHMERILRKYNAKNT